MEEEREFYESKMDFILYNTKDPDVEPLSERELDGNSDVQEVIPPKLAKKRLIPSPIKPDPAGTSATLFAKYTTKELVG